MTPEAVRGIIGRVHEAQLHWRRAGFPSRAALMAGNAAVLKHASNVPGRALAIEQVFRKVGFPENLFVNRMSAVRMGDPLNDDTEIGPLARHDLRDTVHRQVEGSIAKGARCLLGGTIPNSRGAYYPPTVLTDVAKGMLAFDEEVFGPVAAIVPVKDEQQAIATANDTAFGLGGGVFTRDLARGEHIAALIDTGIVFVNEHVSSDLRLPFGGIKESGYGRELSQYGIKEFVNIKTVYVADKDLAT